MKTLRISAFGRLFTAPELIESDAPEPGVGQVLVAMEAAPINPSDLLLIRGLYGHRPHLPATLGTEGVGRVVAVGQAVDPRRTGERVMVMPTLQHGTWQDHVAIDEGDAIPVDPAGDPLQLAMLGVNPLRLVTVELSARFRLCPRHSLLGVGEGVREPIRVCGQCDAPVVDH